MGFVVDCLGYWIDYLVPTKMPEHPKNYSGNYNYFVSKDFVALPKAIAAFLIRRDCYQSASANSYKEIVRMNVSKLFIYQNMSYKVISGKYFVIIFFSGNAYNLE